MEVNCKVVPCEVTLLIHVKITSMNRCEREDGDT